ncbi:hypothetical protein GCM10010245_66750 [Streptomyces spectabilis]|nr:hypothetical protein GCM10010245_66750 [Streptomyces spectabilis]
MIVLLLRTLPSQTFSQAVGCAMDCSCFSESWASAVVMLVPEPVEERRQQRADLAGAVLVLRRDQVHGLVDGDADAAQDLDGLGVRRGGEGVLGLVVLFAAEGVDGAGLAEAGAELLGEAGAGVG